jgi:DNA processing protein
MPAHHPAACSGHAPLSNEEELHWLALRMVGGLGTRQSVRLIQVLRSPQAVFRCSASELRAHGLSGSVAQSIASGCAYEDAVEQQQRLRAAAATLVPISDPRYPPLLREIFDPP